MFPQHWHPASRTTAEFLVIVLAIYEKTITAPDAAVFSGFVLELLVGSTGLVLESTISAEGWDVFDSQYWLA